MNIQQFKKMQKDYEVINASISINNPYNYDREYTSLSDALEPYLDAEELGDLHETLKKLEALTETALENILEKSKEKVV